MLLACQRPPAARQVAAAPYGEHVKRLENRVAFWQAKNAAARDPGSRLRWAGAQLDLAKAAEDPALAEESIRIAAPLLDDATARFDALLLKASALGWLHDFDGARALMAEAAEAAPYDARVLQLLADTALERGRLREARRWLRHLAVEAPGWRTDYRFARLAALSGDRSADALFQATWRRMTNESAVDRSWFLTAWGMQMRRLGETQRAVELFRKAHEAAPDAPEPLVQLGVALADGRQDQEAGEVLRKALATGEHPDALAALLHVRARQGDTAEVHALRERLQSAVTELLTKHRDVWLGHVVPVYATAHPGDPGVVALAEENFRRRPNLDAAITLADTYLAQGLTEKSWLQLQAAYRGEERSAELDRVAGKVYRALGKPAPPSSIRTAAR